MNIAYIRYLLLCAELEYQAIQYRFLEICNSDEEVDEELLERLAEKLDAYAKRCNDAYNALRSLDAL